MVCYGMYTLAHGQHEGYTRRVLLPAEFSEYFIVGEWFGQAVHADILEIENASYFGMISKTTIGKVIEGEDMWLGQSFR